MSILDADPELLRFLAEDEKAAAGGNVNAMVGLGLIYEFGRGVARDYAKAREWYQKAAAKGNADAKARLAKLPSR